MKTINILILWVGLCTLAIADPITMTVDDAVQSALQNNISVKQSQIQLNGLKRAKNTSWNSVHPTIGVSFSGSFLTPDDARYDNPMQGYKQQYTLGGQINLALTPALYSAIKVACVNYENGKLTYDQAVRGIELKVRTAFYNILYQKEYIEVQKRNVETARTQYNQTRQRYQNGRASELDLLSSQVSYESQLPTIQSLELNFEKELATFKQMLGINQENEINLSGSLSDALVLKALDISA
ncbi:MAG: TolC family protein, partial [Treponema sp.]|nr:TolC family protein [Treponema sp.]